MSKSSRGSRRRLSYEEATGETAEHRVCSLCKSHHNRMSNVQSWQNAQATQYIQTLDITLDSLICRPCRDDIRRVLANNSYVPRWNKRNEQSKCCIKSCLEVSFVSSKLADEDKMNQLLKEVDIEMEGDDVPIPTPLCKHHYYTIYNLIQPQQINCPTCGVNLKHVISRPCPNAQVVRDHLQENTAFTGNLSDGDKVCYSCYKFHLLILQECKTSSKDTDLQAILDNMRLKINTECKPCTMQQVCDLAMDRTVVYVGEELLQRKVILLPVVHDFFSKCQNEILAVVNLQGTERRTSMWVLGNLTSTLKHHLVYTCKARKYGTLLYRPNTDLIPILQQTLWKLRQHEIKSQTQQLQPEAPPKPSMDTFLDDLHVQIQDQCLKFRENDFTYVKEYTTLNVDQEIKNLNPDVWKAICMLTRSVSEQKGKLGNQINTEKRKLRRFFLLCCLLFCTDDRCSMPMHVLVADLVDSQGGSAFLIKALNRLGVCASQDTLARFIQSKVDNKRDKHPCTSLFLSNSFTVISADNLDYLHSYARVFKGTQKSSWHGTTVQLVQPLPSIAPVQSQNSLTHHIAHLQLTTTSEEVLPGTLRSLPSITTPSSQSTCNCHDLCAVNTQETTSRKRQERSSPVPSPLKLTRSPAAKAQRRARTGTEYKTSLDVTPTVPIVHIMHSESVKPINQVAIRDYTLSPMENESLSDIQYELFRYMLLKSVVAQAETANDNQLPFINVQDYFSLTRATHTEKSQVAYLEVLDAISDSKDTLLDLLNDLYVKLIVNQNREYLVIEGDQKLYEVLQSLKFEYGKDFDWVLPIPGDWHMLMNYQIAIMKPYFDAGLKDLAKAAGYPVASIQSCGQFKRTHNFLLEAWEALYRALILIFLQEAQSGASPSLRAITTKLLSIKDNFNKDTLANMISETNTILTNNYQEFRSFIQELAIRDDTCKFWIQFVFQDLSAYVGLFLAIRSGDWHLRMASVKQMASVFTAFNHANYLKLISRHLTDLLCMPQSILTMFQQGAFVVSITGRTWHSVGIDEAHEMLINKACKMSVVRPSPDYVNRIAQYLPYRTRALENLSHQLFHEKKQSQTEITSALSRKPDDIKREHNIKCQLEAISKSGLLEHSPANRGLLNPFSKKVATMQQSCDLLSFRDIGQREFIQYISFYILKQPSTPAPLRKGKLQTFSSKKVNKRRVSQLEKDRNLILSCMRKKIKWSLRTGIPIDKAGEQLIALPLAISNHQGNPLKGQKSNMTKVLVTRYQKSSQQIALSEYPQGWQPQCCLIEGMFMINTLPLGGHNTYADYARFLLQRHITPHFAKGCLEVHLLFDNPGQLKNTPKHFEHMRRDQSATIAAGHICDNIGVTVKLPTKWRESVLNCRTCKRTLVCFLAQFMLNNIKPHLKPQQKLYVAGAFEEPLSQTTWFAHGSNSPQPDPNYSCNAEETDTRLWLHATRTQCNQILVLSPDTDVYIIGLPLQCTCEKNIIVQISKMNSMELKLLCPSQLIVALKNDPDLSSITDSKLTDLIQTLYVVTGCDYISFFSGLGKATFLRYFFQHAQFITGVSSFTQGSLFNTQLNDNMYKEGFLAFIRFIGVAYFKKNATAFDLDSPESHFKKFLTSSDVYQQHTAWLEDIRQNIWDRITIETQMIPSMEALWRHWKRSCWVIDMWRQADKNTMQLATITDYGWNLADNVLTIDWDSAKNQAAVNERVLLLTKGCHCKSGCTTGRCGCRKKGQNCTEGCSCLHCSNLPNSQEKPVTEDIDVDDDRQLMQIDDVMEDIFGTWPTNESEEESASDDEVYSGEESSEENSEEFPDLTLF